jgi:hypothetical protein
VDARHEDGMTRDLPYSPHPRAMVASAQPSQ